MKSGGAIVSFLIFAVLFGFVTWIFELGGARILVLQHRAESFPMVQGKVLSGEVLLIHGSRGSVSYRPRFLYEYEVTGQTYTGRRYRYDRRPSFSESASAEQIVKMHPKGSEIDVYYNPADPSDAVLSPRLEGFDAGLLLVGLPICLMALYGMVKFGRMLVFPERVVPIAGGVKIISERMTTRVRLPQYDPWYWSLTVIGVSSFISGMAVSIAAHTAFEVAEMAMLFIAIAGGVVYFWLWKKISSGSQDLVIDEAARTVELPLSYKRRELIQCAFSDITGVSLQKVAHRRRYGVSYTYAPALLIAGKEPQRLTDLNKRRAESFASWLREKLGLQANAEAALVQK